MNSARTFRLRFPDVLLTIDDIWPDGGAPANPTAADVLKVMDQDGGTVGQLIREWQLVHEIQIVAIDGSRAVKR